MSEPTFPAAVRLPWPPHRRCMCVGAAPDFSQHEWWCGTDAEEEQEGMQEANDEALSQIPDDERDPDDYRHGR